MDNEYIHKVNKAEIPVCNIMGVNIAAINMEWLLGFTEKNIKNLSGDYMCVSNVHTTVTAYENSEYSTVQNRGIMAIPDGGPLSFIGQKRGYKNMQRITGPSYMEEIMQCSVKKEYRHFFYGSTEVTLERLRVKLKEKYPEIQIVGICSPPFRPLTSKEDKEIIEQINKANPDFIWVGLGAPKQEKWMAVHQGKVNGFMIGVGAAFDYLSGNIKRAPKWMQTHSLEWLYRLLQEPKRLFGRYIYTNTKFIWYTLIRGK